MKVCCLSPVNFDGSPSTFLWEDELGIVNHVQQGEGGEQGDPLMPMVFAFRQHSALVAVSSPDKAVECSHIMRQASIAGYR